MIETRKTLAGLIGRQRDAEGEQAAARAALQRLETVAASAAPAEAELAALDSAEARAFAQWSAGDADAPLPVPDVGHRQAIEAKLASALAAAAAAAVAAQGPRSEIHRLQAEVASLAAGKVGLAAEIALGEFASLIGEVAELAGGLATRRQQLGAARNVLLSAVEAIPHDRRPVGFFRALESLDQKISEALAPAAPAPGSEAETVATFHTLLARLIDDAEATLEGQS